ncbi:MAG: phage holin family protein [Armatimonadota bacterium]|nr:phage holin family protein [bacterium]MCS7309375.1 phage holin family protein [Armatimonadota bacterium]MDW8104380.1 phage holin family protein [Armatimonadota bacterium]MDW8290464.1 phage holin family protein [Armatimonadota bacterium]
MVGIVLRWVASAVALLLTVWLGKTLGLGLYVSGFGGALIAALVIGLINAFIRPLVMMFTLPLNCLTFGLFGLVINAVLFWLAGELLAEFEVEGPVAALFGSIVMSIFSSVLSQAVAPEKRRE